MATLVNCPTSQKLCQVYEIYYIHKRDTLGIRKEEFEKLFKERIREMQIKYAEREELRRMGKKKVPEIKPFSEIIKPKKKMEIRPFSELIQ